MADRRRHRALAQVAALRAAERDAARQELALAGQRLDRADAESRRAADRVVAAGTAWQAHLSGQSFAPELARALGGRVIAEAEGAAEAARVAATMAEQRDTCADSWRHGDARCRQIDQALESSRRTLARDREERALAATADRVTAAWVGR